MSDGSQFRGNTNLKPRLTQIEFTPEMVEEYMKCSNDIIYFAEKYVQIVHIDRGLIPIEMYDYQKDIIHKFVNGRWTIVCTSRQAGKTTAAVLIILHYALFNGHKTTALLANKGDSAREILDRIKIAYQALPSWLQQGVVEWNKGSVEFENGSKILAAASSSSAIRGKSISLLYIDETAFVENWDEFFASVYPTISSGNTSKILLTSTPNGLNHFYKTWIGAIEGRNGYQHILVPWQAVPGRDQKWKDETLQAMDGDLQKFAQEYEGEFMGSSGTLITGSKLKSLVPKTPILENEGLKQYFKPVDGKIYAIVADVSRGKGLDYSAFSVFDITKMPYSQVTSFRDNMVSPMDYASIIYRMSRMYNDAYVLVEINDIGGQVGESLLNDFECETLLSTQSQGRSGKVISSGYGKNVDRGIRTTKTVKNIGCNNLKMLIEQDQLIINDFDTINELSTFAKRGLSFEAESGAHDDLVMGCVLFAWLTNQLFFKELTDINTLDMLRQRSEEDVMNDLMPFGFYDDGMEDESEQTLFF